MPASIATRLRTTGGRGVTIGNSRAASPSAELLNNIVQGNGGDASVKVFEKPRSDLRFVSDHNVIFPASYIPATLAGENDIGQDARFRNQPANDFRLVADSPAIDAGGALTLTSLQLDLLHGRTTTGTGNDTDPLDLGFHF